MDDSKPEIESCIRILSSSNTDNEQFAALMTVAKVVKAETLSMEGRKRIFEAIGFKFIKRLLRSSKVPEGCPEHIYKSLALTILSCFCTDQELVKDANMISCIPDFNNLLLLTTSGAADDPTAQMVNDCYDCLVGMATQPEGRQGLQAYHCVDVLCQVVAGQLFGHEKAMGVLKHMIRYDGPATWRGNEEGLSRLLQYLTQQFHSTKDKEKLSWCRNLTEILLSVEKNQVCCSKPWVAVARETVFELMQCKSIVKNEAEPLLTLSATLVQLFGVPWTFMEKNRKLLQLLLNVACIEIRMTLDDREITAVLGKTPLLCSCFSLIEGTISYLTREEEPDLTAEQIMQLHSSMTASLQSVLQFLAEVSLKHEEQSTSFVVCACVRLVSVWMAEETEALKKEVCKLLPFLIKVGTDTFNLNRLASPTNHLAMETDGALSGTLPTGHTVDIFRLLLPGLVNLSQENAAASVLVDCKAPEALTEYFVFTLGNYRSCDTESSATLCQLCELLINLLNVEVQLTELIQHNLIQTLAEALPAFLNSLPDENVLLLHLCALGVKCLSSGPTKEILFSVDPEKCQCLLDTTFKVVSNPTVLELNKDYTTGINGDNDLEEPYLWILQGFCELCEEEPAIASRVMESGWIKAFCEKIVTRKAEKLSEEINEHYCQMMTTLATSKPEHRAQIVAWGGKQVARCLKWKEFEKLLEGPR